MLSVRSASLLAVLALALAASSRAQRVAGAAACPALRLLRRMADCHSSYAVPARCAPLETLTAPRAKLLTAQRVPL
jgi:hypothetical protein